MSPTAKMSNLFDQIDASGSGSINQAQFTQAFQAMNPPATFQAAGAASVWGSLDSTGSGKVSKQDFVSVMTTLMKQLRGAQVGASASGVQQLSSSTDALASLGGAAKSDTDGTSESATVGTVLDTLA